MAAFNIASFNCKNFNNVGTRCFIENKFNDCQILLLQEHWLYESQFHLFDNVFGSNIPVSYNAKSAMDQSIIRSGRPFGGNAIIWKSNIKNKIYSIDTVSTRLTCIHVSLDDENSVIIFNVYMPCDTGQRGNTFIEFQNILSEVHEMERLLCTR